MHKTSFKQFKKKIITIFFLICLVSTEIVFAADIILSASVDKNQLTLEDTIELSIKITGVRNPEIPVLPELSDFIIRSAGTQSSTQIFNSNVQTTTIHKYLLIPKNEGTFIIDPIKLEQSGAIYKSKSISVKVQKTNPKKSNLNKSVYAETSVSKINPFINEQITYTFKLFRRVETRNLNLSMPFNETYFRKENLGKAKRYSQLINGIPYDIDELSMALFPIKSGKAIVPSSMMELDLIYQRESNRRRDPFARFFNDPFFGRNTKSDHKILTTKPIKIKAKILPNSEKPKEFRNLVGRFSLSATIGKNILEIGDTTTLTVTISGTGNIMDATLDNPNIHKNFKIYPDQPIYKQSIHGNLIGGEKTFKFALVPYKTGNQTIPPIELNYFNPEKNVYKKTSTKIISLTIMPGVISENLNLVTPSTSRTDQDVSGISILDQDILPIHNKLENFKNLSIENNLKIIYVCSLFLPVVIYLFATVFIRYTHQMKNNTSFSRKHKAYNKAKQSLDHISKSNYQKKDLIKKLSFIIREYLGDKLNLQGTAFTSKEMEKILIINNFPLERISIIKKLLNKYESMQYSPVSINEDQGVIDESINLIKILEKKS